MTWNYRVVQWVGPVVNGTEPVSEDGQPTQFGTCYEIREVYYDDAGTIKAFSFEPVAPFGESLDELRRDLANFVGALDRPVLKLSELEALFPKDLHSD